MLESSLFYICAFMSSPHIMEDPNGAKVLKDADTAKSPEVHVGARETTDQGGATETRNPSRPRGIEEPSFIFESSVLHTCVFTTSPSISCLYHLMCVYFPILNSLASSFAHIGATLFSLTCLSHQCVMPVRSYHLLIL